MPLYLIQDDAHPAYVVAKDYSTALRQWQTLIKKRTNGKEYEPKRLSIVAPDTELVVDGKWVSETPARPDVVPFDA